jgi:hypothetical protein
VTDTNDDDEEGFAARAKKEADEAAKREKYVRRRTTTLDAILRKITRCGNKSQLTRAEEEFLERTSKELEDEGVRPSRGAQQSAVGWEPPQED